MRLIIGQRPGYAPAFEVVERKGIGHPDTLCDALAETLGRHLASLMVERLGAVGHFNVDKGLLVGGEAEMDYAGGRIVTPIRIILAGRVDLAAAKVQPEELLSRLREALGEMLPWAPEGAVEVELSVGRPASELARLTAPDGPPLANDTSFAVVSLPRSPLEETVHRVARRLNEPRVRDELPIGTDVKVMGHRVGDDVALTVAAPVRAGAVSGPRAYEEVRAEVAGRVEETAAENLRRVPAVTVNAAAGPYLTLTGSSAEAGDDGEVGRGNGFGGLLAPYRPESGEAPAGKNPVSHVGKTYHAVAHDIATRLLDAGGEVTVGLLSRIGRPVTEPAAVHVETMRPVDEDLVEAVVAEALQDWAGVRDRLLAGEYELF